MLEEHEEILEQWFFLEYSRGIDNNLQQYLCIDKLKGYLSTILFKNSFHGEKNQVWFMQCRLLDIPWTGYRMGPSLSP